MNAHSVEETPSGCLCQTALMPAACIYIGGQSLIALFRDGIDATVLEWGEGIETLKVNASKLPDFLKPLSVTVQLIYFGFFFPIKLEGYEAVYRGSSTFLESVKSVHKSVSPMIPLFNSMGQLIIREGSSNSVLFTKSVSSTLRDYQLIFSQNGCLFRRLALQNTKELLLTIPRGKYQLEQQWGEIASFCGQSDYLITALIYLTLDEGSQNLRFAWERIQNSALSIIDDIYKNGFLAGHAAQLVGSEIQNNFRANIKQLHFKFLLNQIESDQYLFWQFSTIIAKEMKNYFSIFSSQFLKQLKEDYLLVKNSCLMLSKPPIGRELLSYGSHSIKYLSRCIVDINSFDHSGFILLETTRSVKSVTEDYFTTAVKQFLKQIKVGYAHIHNSCEMILKPPVGKELLSYGPHAIKYLSYQFKVFEMRLNQDFIAIASTGRMLAKEGRSSIKSSLNYCERQIIEVKVVATDLDKYAKSVFKQTCGQVVHDSNALSSRVNHLIESCWMEVKQNSKSANQIFDITEKVLHQYGTMGKLALISKWERMKLHLSQDSARVSKSVTQSLKEGNSYFCFMERAANNEVGSLHRVYKQNVKWLQVVTESSLKIGINYIDSILQNGNKTIYQTAETLVDLGFLSTIPIKPLYAETVKQLSINFSRTQGLARQLLLTAQDDFKTLYYPFVELNTECYISVNFAIGHIKANAAYTGNDLSNALTLVKSLAVQGIRDLKNESHVLLSNIHILPSATNEISRLATISTYFGGDIVNEVTSLGTVTVRELNKVDKILRTDVKDVIKTLIVNPIRLWGKEKKKNWALFNQSVRETFADMYLNFQIQGVALRRQFRQITGQ